jgi:quercetin dioxygenase-like cupin family protein
MAATFLDVDEIRPSTPAERVLGRPIFGSGATVDIVELEANAAVPEHSHPHEQIGFVLRGIMEMTIDGETRQPAPMEGFVIPGGVAHAGRSGPDGATVVDVFHPAREDIRAQWSATPA